jgi:hypothetical protein
MVPVDYEIFRAESHGSLFLRIREVRARLQESVDVDIIDQQSLITPTCGIQFGNEQMAEEVLTATASLAKRCREEFL